MSREGCALCSLTTTRRHHTERRGDTRALVGVMARELYITHCQRLLMLTSVLSS
jgi:hypothetical protein